MPFYNVSRTVKGGFPGYGVQDITQTKTVQSNTPPAAGAGQTVTPNLTASAPKDWGLDRTQTNIPAPAADKYGGFPH